ncbi:hypothetical protein GOODEAATRI_033313, partial [Goodea atripinnis]
LCHMFVLLNSSLVYSPLSQRTCDLSCVHSVFSRCPVCRYCQTPEPVEENKCFECGVQENLWICLICGHIGCGRYVSRHAYKHFEETQHTYAMQLTNHRVWDYAGGTGF